jgi:hypothetical protein
MFVAFASTYGSADLPFTEEATQIQIIKAANYNLRYATITVF